MIRKYSHMRWTKNKGQITPATLWLQCWYPEMMGFWGRTQSQEETS